LLKPKDTELNESLAPVVAPTPAPRVIPRDQHTVSRSKISPNALRVLYRLREGGYQAFLVGGCVRDILIGIEPKDFDVTTDASPEEVKKLFRNCRLIGRRFRLAHVFFGRDIIEVATFRAATAPPQGDEPEPDPEPDLEDENAVEAAIEADLDTEEDHEEGHEGNIGDDARYRRPPPGPRRAEGDEPLDVTLAAGADSDSERVFDKTGRIVRDNVYGTIDQDVWRRDFTANSLYYNIADFSLWDYTGGYEDIAARTLRLIGDPETRYREDPVRMLRAARFEAKLPFTLDAATSEPIERLKGLMAGVPPARLFDEMLKLFLTGHGESSLEVLRRRGLLAQLLPSVDAYLSAHPGGVVEKLLIQGLRNTDDRVRAGKPVTPTFLLALLLYGPIASIIEAMPPEHWHELRAILDAVFKAVRQVQAHMTVPRRFSLGVQEMFALQPRLEHPRGRRALRMIEHPRFRAAYDLLLLRAENGLASAEMAEWWTNVQQASPQEREAMADSVQGKVVIGEGGASAPLRRGGRNRRRRRRPARQS
jgi:poly(A) polymerase